MLMVTCFQVHTKAFLYKTGHVLGREGECWVEAGCRIVLETGNSGYVTDMAFKEEAAVQNDTEGVDVW